MISLLAFITPYIQTIDAFLGSYPIMLLVMCCAIALKLCILYPLVKKFHISHRQLPLLLLSIVLVGSIIVDSAWVLKLIQLIFIPSLDYRLLTFWIRIAWMANSILYQSLALFTESMVIKDFRFNARHKISIILSTLFALFFLGIAIVNLNCSAAAEKPIIESIMRHISSVIALVPIMIPAIFKLVSNMRNDQLPRILRKQIQILGIMIIIPHWFSDFLQISPFDLRPEFITGSFTFTNISAILLTYAIYYCARRMTGLRFLNFSNHVQAPISGNFVDNFKHTIEQLGQVTSTAELKHITQAFFKEMLRIPIGKVVLYIRNEHTGSSNGPIDIPTVVETFFTTHDSSICTTIQQCRILIYDEVAFDEFYDSSPQNSALLNFLDTINADILVPIYEKEKLIAYVIVERFARHQQFYSALERDEIVIFASYLNKIITLIQTKDLNALIAQEKTYKEELYRKHQEINQYKESVRSFLRSAKTNLIGIIFYKNRRFSFANKAAKEIVAINPNVQEGHPLTKSLRQVVHTVEAYKQPYELFAIDTQGEKVILSAVPNLDHNTVIITIYYPDLTDIVKKQLDVLQDPSHWDYVLYLETTQSGKLINQLIPSYTPTLLQFKIELLKTALSKKALLLCIPDDDLLPTVEILHHISLRETLHILDLNGPETNFDTAIKLFGINPIFGTQQQEEPLLSRLSSSGTLFIKNIHLLSRETQESLAECIRYGYFKMFKSELKLYTNARIICSTNRKLAQLVQTDQFSKALFDELKHTTLTMPSLIHLEGEELSALAQGFSEQALKNDTLKNLFELTEKDKTRLVDAKPASLQEMKDRVQKILSQKSKKNEIYHEMQFDPAYQVSDPELVQAARLGKHALKDPQLMAALWTKFNKNQNQIATFLGVNRSSINRRCKEYNLL